MRIQSFRGDRRWLVGLVVISSLGWGGTIGYAEAPDTGSSPESPRTAPPAIPAANKPTRTPLPLVTMLERGAIQSFSVDGLERIAIGDPGIADVTAVSHSELLIQAKTAGKTNLIVWDQQGKQQTSTIEVVERASEAPQAIEPQLRRLLESLKLTDVSVKRENDKLFLIGEVKQSEDVQRLEQMLTAFPSVTNLVRVAPPPPPAAQLGELIKLAVQVIEINRSDVEKLGVKWSEGVTFTEPEVTDRTMQDALTRFGTSITRGTFAATLNALVEKKRARVLAEPKLVTASGKQASSFIGVEVPIVTATSFGTTTSTVSTSIDYRQTGVLLKMTPTLQTIEDHRKITTVIEAELSDVDTSVALNVPVGSQTVLVPGFKVRKANTEVSTNSGESIFIAGLLESKLTENVSQLPALGSVPVLGRLFRSPSNEATQREVVIVVTPELLSASAEAVQTGERGYQVEQALDVAQVTVKPTVKDPILQYAMAVQERIAKAIRYPEREKNLNISGQVKLRVHLFRDGTLGRALVSESSGVQSFDAEALKAAEVQSPYQPFPSEISQQDLWLELPVIFRP